MAGRTFRLTPGKRILFLTKDPEKIRQQLSGELHLTMDDVSIEDLMDDINTDAMTPAWVCFDHDPALIARNAYAGLLVEGERLVPENALADGGFEAVVSGYRKGVGSSRETAAQCEVFSGSRLAVAVSFAPIHARNNINIGQLMCDHQLLKRLQAGEEIPLEEFTRDHDPITRLIVEHGGLFPFVKAYQAGEVSVPAPDTSERPMNMTEKVLASKLVTEGSYVKPGDPVLVRVDGGYSHEFTTAQVHHFLRDNYGNDYQLADPSKFAVFEDHLIYATGVPRMAPFTGKIETLRKLQREYQIHTGVRDFGARHGVSPGICHQIAREQLIEPGDFIQATDSHTCMGGASNALSWGVGTSEFAALAYSGFTFLVVPEAIRFELVGELRPGSTAKDVMLHILATFAKEEKTLNRVMEIGGPGLMSLSADERATLANMATECAARGAIFECDELMLEWIAARREGVSADDLRAGVVTPDDGAEYAGGVHTIDLSTISPMVATPGDPEHGVPSDPTNGAAISTLVHTPIDIAYGGSCTAGKIDDVDMYARVMQEAFAAGRKVADGCEFFIQFGSTEVAEHAKARGYLELFENTGVKVIEPGCGACIGCGPGVSATADQVSISAINRNYKGRSGPGSLYLASPLSVAASAVQGRIVAYDAGMFTDED